MTDAKRLAKMWVEASGYTWNDAYPPSKAIGRAQRLIDQGVTLPPPPDPAQQIAEAWQAAGRPLTFVAVMSQVRRLIASGHIVPGPACEGVEPDAVTAAEREVIAAAEDWADGEPGASEADAHRHACVAGGPGMTASDVGDRVDIIGRKDNHNHGTVLAVTSGRVWVAWDSTPNFAAQWLASDLEHVELPDPHDATRTDGKPPWPPTWAAYGQMWEQRDKALAEVRDLRAVRDAAAALMNEVLADGCQLDPAEEVLKAALDAHEEADR